MISTVDETAETAADARPLGYDEGEWWERYTRRLSALPITGDSVEERDEVLRLAGFHAPRTGARFPAFLNPEATASTHWRMVFVLSGRHAGLD